MNIVLIKSLEIKTGKPKLRIYYCYVKSTCSAIEQISLLNIYLSHYTAISLKSIKSYGQCSQIFHVSFQNQNKNKAYISQFLQEMVYIVPRFNKRNINS